MKTTDKENRNCLNDPTVKRRLLFYRILTLVFTLSALVNAGIAFYYVPKTLDDLAEMASKLRNDTLNAAQACESPSKTPTEADLQPLTVESGKPAVSNGPAPKAEVRIDGFLVHTPEMDRLVKGGDPNQPLIRINRNFDGSPVTTGRFDWEGYIMGSVLDLWSNALEDTGPVTARVVGSMTSPKRNVLGHINGAALRMLGINPDVRSRIYVWIKPKPATLDRSDEAGNHYSLNLAGPLAYLQ